MKFSDDFIITREKFKKMEITIFGDAIAPNTLVLLILKILKKFRITQNLQRTTIKISKIILSKLYKLKTKCF